jgi:hypothetical protein
MIPKSRYRVWLGTNAKRLPADHAQTKISEPAIDPRRIPADRCGAALKSPERRWRSIRTPRGSHRRAAACSAAGTRRSGPRPASARCKAGIRRACRQAAVRRFPDTPRKKQEFERRCRRRSRSQGSGILGVLAYPILPWDSVARVFRRQSCFVSGFKRNAAEEGSRRSTICESEDALPYSTLPIFFTAAIRRAESSATNFENSGASI